jgi:hypothetical protein
MKCVVGTSTYEYGAGTIHPLAHICQAILFYFPLAQESILYLTTMGFRVGRHQVPEPVVE